MFDVGFFELILISVVALLILGPDKLPGAIRTLGLWIGRLRRNFDNIKKDIEREIGADEIRRQLRNEAIMEKFNESKKELTAGFGAVKKETESAIKDAESLKNDVEAEGQRLTDSQQTAAGGSTEDDDNAAESSDTAAQSPSDKEARAPEPAADPAPQSSDIKSDDKQ